MILRDITSVILLSNFRELVQRERRISRDVLEYIAEIEKRRLYADEGFTSTHDWLVRIHGYSHAAAGRRVNAARLLGAVPDVAAKIETGELCMSTLNRVQSAIRSEEQRTGLKIPIDRKIEVIAEVQARPMNEIDRSLADIFQVSAPKRDLFEPKSGGETRAHLTFSNEQMATIIRAAELLTHVVEKASSEVSMAAAIVAMAEVVIAQKDPLVKTVKARKSASIETTDQLKSDNAKQDRCGVGLSPSIKNLVHRRADGACQFVNSLGEKCGSRKFVQIDHIRPGALGGSSEPENLRVLCRTHNLLMAERVFGPQKIGQFRPSR